MVWIEPGRFKMGSEAFRIEEAPVHEVAVDGFWIDSHDVTNAQFDRFVRETGWAPSFSIRETLRSVLASR